MNSNWFVRPFALLAAWNLTVACSKSPDAVSPSARQEHTEASATPSVVRATASLPSQALAEAKTYVASRFLQRGDSWVSFQNNGGFYDVWIEYKNLRFNLESSGSSTAERLNGIDFKAEVGVACDAKRECHWNTKVPGTAIWREWEDFDRGDLLFVLNVMKRGEQWKCEGLEENIVKPDQTRLSQIANP